MTTLLLIFTECAGEIIFKIGQYLEDIWIEVCSILFGSPFISAWFSGVCSFRTHRNSAHRPPGGLPGSLCLPYFHFGYATAITKSFSLFNKY